MGVVMTTWPIFYFGAPIKSLAWVKLSTSSLWSSSVLAYRPAHDRLPPNGLCSGSRDLFKFWQSNRYYLENGTRQRHSHSRRLIRCHLWPANGTTPMTVRNHKGYFSCFRPFWFPCRRKHNISYLQYVYTRIGRCTWPVISTVVSKMKNFSRSQAVMYAVKLVIFRKRCNRDDVTRDH